MGRRKFFLLAAATAILMPGAGQARKSRDPGPNDARSIPLERFDRIAVGGPFVVKVHTGKEAKVSLSGPRTMLDDTEMFVRDGQLIIGWQEGSGWSRKGNHGVDIDIALPSLREVTIAGAGEITIDRVHGETFSAKLLSSGTVNVDELQVIGSHVLLAGSGSLAINRLAAKNFAALVAGSGAIRVAGRTDTIDLQSAGSGAFDSPRLVASDATITQAGSGAIRATVTNTATIKAMGSGDISLTGGATCTVAKHGSGNVTCR